MSGYRKLNLDKLNFSKKTVSFEEATKDVETISFPTDVINGIEFKQILDKATRIE